MPPKILVTGATGTIGSHTIRELVRHQIPVRAGVHRLDHAAPIAAEGVEIFPFDWNSISSVRALLKGVESALLVTPACEDQLEWVETFVECARQTGLGHVVRLSVLGSDSNPGTILTRSHRMAEDNIASSGIHFTFIQPNSFMQGIVTSSALASGMIYRPLGEGRISFIDAADVAQTAAEVLLSGRPHYGESYSLTGPTAIGMEEAAEILSNVLQRHVAYINISEETALHAMESQGLSRWMSHAMIELHAEAKAGLRALVTRDVELVTGHDPVSFRQFVADHADELRAASQMTANATG